MELQERLKLFHEYKNEVDIQNEFYDLSLTFLYGGHIKVGDHSIYIKTVEFYYHSEKADGIHDPIVYHRNNRDLKDCPYFPLMTLNAHASGFDITFENESEKYRASALIRSYEIKNKDGKYLKWEKTIDNKSMFVEHDDYQFNTQSTYLYAILNGFSLCPTNGIVWEDEPREQGQPIAEPRKNVFKSISNTEYKPFAKNKERKDIKCERLWSFTRKEIV